MVDCLDPIFSDQSITTVQCHGALISRTRVFSQTLIIAGHEVCVYLLLFLALSAAAPKMTPEQVIFR